MSQKELGTRLQGLREKVAGSAVVHHSRGMTIEGYPGEPPHTKELLRETLSLPSDWVRRVDLIALPSAPIGDMEAFGIADSGRDLFFPAILQAKLVATTAEVQDSISQRPLNKPKLGELREYSNKLQELRARMLLLQESFSDHHGLNLADELTALLRVMVFSLNHPGADLNTYDDSLNELTDESLNKGIEKLFENDANNFFSIFDKLIGYLSTLRASQTRNREQELREERAQYWVSGEAVLSDVVGRLNGVSVENLQKAFKAALVLSTNSFYARAEIDSLTTSIEEEIAWTQLEIERAEVKEQQMQQLLEVRDAPIRELEALFLRIADNLGIRGRYPTASEFGQWAIHSMFEWCENYTRDQAGYGDITFQVGDDQINVITLYRMLEKEVPKDSHLKKYMEPYITMIYPYFSARIGARKMKKLVMQNYASLKDLYAEAEKVLRVTEDSNFSDVYVGSQLIEDSWQREGFTPFAERFRTAAVIYDKLATIYEIANQKDDFFKKRYVEKGYVREAAAFYGTRLAENDPRIPDFSRAILLTEQDDLGFLTVNEALFLIRNVGALMPREMITADQELQTITSLRLFSALGPIRSDKFKGQKELMLGAVITDSLRVEVKNQKIQYLWEGVAINEWNGTNSDSSARFLVHYNNRWIVVGLAEANRLRIRPQDRHDLYSLLEEMRFHGGLAESIVSDVSWITMARARADVHTKGFMSQQVRFTDFYRHVTRYMGSMYPEESYPFAKIFPHILGTTLEMIQITGRPNSGSPISTESLLEVYVDEDYDLADPESRALWYQHTNLSINEDRADQIKRALAIYQLIENYSERLNFGLRQAYLNNADVGKLREGLRQLYKDLKYFEEMFSVSGVFRALIKNGEDPREMGVFKGANLGEAMAIYERGDEDGSRKTIIHYLQVEMILVFFSEFAKKLYDEEAGKRTELLDDVSQDSHMEALIESFVEILFSSASAINPVVDKMQNQPDKASSYFEWMLPGDKEELKSLLRRRYSDARSASYKQLTSSRSDRKIIDPETRKEKVVPKAKTSFELRVKT